MQTLQRENTILAKEVAQKRATARSPTSGDVEAFIQPSTESQSLNESKTAVQVVNVSGGDISKPVSTLPQLALFQALVQTEALLRLTVQQHSNDIQLNEKAKTAQSSKDRHEALKKSTSSKPKLSLAQTVFNVVAAQKEQHQLQQTVEPAMTPPESVTQEATSAT